MLTPRVNIHNVGDDAFTSPVRDNRLQAFTMGDKTISDVADGCYKMVPYTNKFALGFPG